MQKRLLIWFIIAFLLITTQAGFFSKDADVYIQAKKEAISTRPPAVIATSTRTQPLVVRVVDGDTIIAKTNGIEERVRLIGVDTPETVDPRKPVECFGKEASVFTTITLLNKSVTLESDPTQSDRDKYGRLLRYVFLTDGTLFNKVLINEGYGYEYTYNTPYNYQKEFKQAQASAKELKKGLWADGACAK